MNLTTVKTIGSTLVLISALTACKGKSETEDTVATATPAAEMAPAAAPEAMPAVAPEAMPTVDSEAVPMAIPETADAIWQEIDKHSAELKATIDSGSLSEVHHHAFAIRDLVAALPTHSPTLPAKEQKKLQGEVKFVSTLADRLDQSGDGNDKAATQSSYDQLVKVLGGITRNK